MRKEGRMLKIEKFKAVQDVVKVSEAVCLLDAEVKKLKRKNGSLVRLLREGLGLIESLEKQSKHSGEKI
jgi:FtsZ-binding cell division protein ZapB